MFIYIYIDDYVKIITYVTCRNRLMVGSEEQLEILYVDDRMQLFSVTVKVHGSEWDVMHVSDGKGAGLLLLMEASSP